MLKFIDMPVTANAADDGPTTDNRGSGNRGWGSGSSGMNFTQKSYHRGFQDGYNKVPPPESDLAAYFKGHEEGEKCYARRGTNAEYDEGFKDGLTLGLEAVNPYPHNGCQEALDWCIGLVHGSLMKD